MRPGASASSRRMNGTAGKTVDALAREDLERVVAPEHERVGVLEDDQVTPPAARRACTSPIP